jgi:hypothetical protein
MGRPDAPEESNMNKTLVLLLLALCSFAAVPQSRSLAANLGSAAYVQGVEYGQGSPLRLDEVGTSNAGADGGSAPAPIKVGLIGVVVACFIAVRRLG